MFTKKTKIESLLDTEINAALEELKDLDKNSNEYGQRLERISKLHKLKAEESPKRISPDNALVVAANLVGIIVIIHHERVAMITTKAMSFVMRPR